jgi:hypothetical protein
VWTRCPGKTNFDSNTGTWGTCESELNGYCFIMQCAFRTGPVFVSFGPDSPFYGWCPRGNRFAVPLIMRCADGMRFNEMTGMCEPMGQ